MDGWMDGENSQKGPWPKVQWRLVDISPDRAHKNKANNVSSHRSCHSHSVLWQGLLLIIVNTISDNFNELILGY